MQIFAIKLQLPKERKLFEMKYMKAKKYLKRAAHPIRTLTALKRMRKRRDISYNLLGERLDAVAEEHGKIYSAASSKPPLYGSAIPKPEQARALIRKYTFYLDSLRAARAKLLGRKEMERQGKKLLASNDESLKSGIHALAKAITKKELEILNKKWRAYAECAGGVIAKERKRADFAFELSRLTSKVLVPSVSRNINFLTNTRKRLINDLRKSTQESN